MNGNLVAGGPYIVESSETGTVIGALALESGAITDVGPDVSAKHLRIYVENSTWYAQDIGSTNGTCLIRADSNETLDISHSEPTQLHPGDLLRLGLSTTFAVVAVAPELTEQRNRKEE